MSEPDAPAPTLPMLIHAWGVAGAEEQAATLQRLLQAAGEHGERVRSLPPSLLQQLLTQLLQASLSSGALPSGASPEAMAQRERIERLWRLLATGGGLSADSRTFGVLASLLQAHTPAPGPSNASRRGSLVGSPLRNLTSMLSAAAGSRMASRRGSLCAPVEEQTVASIRHHAFRFAIEFVQAHMQIDQTAAAATVDAKGSTASSPAPTAAVTTTAPLLSDPSLVREVCNLYVRGVTDMWSAIRKTAASALARSTIVTHLTDAQLQELFETLVQLALGQQQQPQPQQQPNAIGLASPATPSSPRASTKQVYWQVQEGAVMGISSLLSSWIKRQTLDPSRPLPSFLAEAPPRFYPLLAHAQLSVREHTCAVLRGFVHLLPEPQSSQLKHELLDTLMQKLAHGKDRVADGAEQEAGEHTNAAWLSDYQSEGILSVLHALGLPLVDEYLTVLDRYLSHPASSVRQLVAEIFAKLASDTQRQHPGAPATATATAFDLPAFLVHEWEWDQSETEAAMTASVSSHLADVHTAAVFFVLPPPLSVAPSVAGVAAAVASRRGSGAAPSKAASPSATPDTPVPAEAVSSIASSTPRHRATWQWKEGALMCLELYLRSIAPQRDAASSSAPSVASSHLQSLAQLFPQVVRAAASWSWELRRMAEQLRNPFLAVWMHYASPAHHAGKDIARMCHVWLSAEAQPRMPIPSSPTAVVSPTVGPHAVSLSAAVSTVICLKYVLSYMQRVQLLAAKRASSAAHNNKASAATDDECTERKWQQELEDLEVHPEVSGELSKQLPLILTRLEQLMLSAHIVGTDHAATSAASLLSASGSIDHPAAGPPTLLSAPPLVSWEQFSTLAVEVCILAYAVHFGSSSSTPAGARSASSTFHATLRSSEHSKLQHYQCVLDRLRWIRSMSVGEELPPAPSVAAQMPPTPLLPTSPVATAAMHLLPSILPVSVPAAEPTTKPPVAAAHKLAMLQRARAKRLELWILTHVGSAIPAFTGAVPAAAHIDLLSLLCDYLRRFHSATADVRSCLLKSFAVGWLRLGIVQQSVSLWSHQLHQLHAESLTLLLQLLSEHAGDRALVVAALTALVGSTPLLTTQLRDVLECVAGMVPDEYERVLLDSPPPAPTLLLSPTSAALAAAVEAWDDWDEDDDSATVTTTDSRSRSGSNAAVVAYETFMHARQLVAEVAPLLIMLEAQPYVASRSRAPSSSSSSTPAALAGLPPAHCQSSLSTLVSAYELESTAAQPDPQRQVELLQWIQQWASQVQQQLEAQGGVACAPGPAVSASSSRHPPSVMPPVSSTRPRFSTHQCMPLNPPLRDTLQSLAPRAQAKIGWMQEQGRVLAAAPAPHS